MSYAPPDAEDPRKLVEHQAALGFYDEQETYNRLTDAYTDIDESVFNDLIDEVFAARERAMESWPRFTACDRLDAAFEMLEERGVLARHHFACCQRCGTYEIHDEIAEAREKKRRVDGYVFYHWQDTDAAVEGQGLHLRYGGVAGVEDVEIGRRIVAAIVEAGLEAVWNGEPTQAIHLPLEWQRRSAPIPIEAQHTAASCVAAWCDGLPRATLSSAAAGCEQLMPLALEAAKLSDAADVWARAPFDDGERAVSLARLAVSRPELLVEAWRLAPYDRSATFVRLLIEGGVPEAVFELACMKIEECRRDELGGAAAAWLWAFAPHLEPARDRAQAAWDHRRTSLDHELVLAAGLWRAGDATMKETVAAKLAHVFYPWAYEVALAAPTTVGDLMELAANLGVLAPASARRRVCSRLLELGDVDRARSHAKASSEADEAFVAWRTGDGETIARIAGRFDEHATLYREGVLTKDEVRDIRIFVGAATANPELLASIADAAIEETLASPTVETASVSASKVEAVATQWQRQMPRGKRFGMRRQGRKLLNTAVAHARAGELERARQLVDLVCAPFATAEEPAYDLATCGITDELVQAFVALGDLDRVEELAAHTRLAEIALAAYVPALVAAGELARAVTYLGDAIAKAGDRRGYLELMPAVLAVADDKTRVHDACRRAEEHVQALRIRHDHTLDRIGSPGVGPTPPTK